MQPRALHWVHPSGLHARGMVRTIGETTGRPCRRRRMATTAPTITKSLPPKSKANVDTSCHGGGIVVPYRIIAKESMEEIMEYIMKLYFNCRDIKAITLICPSEREERGRERFHAQKC
jgi:hypothetical protein